MPPKRLKKSKAWPKYENQLIHLCHSFLSRDFNSFLCYFRRIFRVGMSPTRCRQKNSRSLSGSSALQSRPWIRVGGWRTFIRCHLTLLFSLCFFHILYIQLLGPQKGVGKCFWRCPGTSMPSAAHPMIFLILCGAGSNIPGKSRAPEGAVSTSKALQISKTKKGELLEGLEKKISLRQQNFFSLWPL